MSKTRIELATEKFKEQWALMDSLGLEGYRVQASLLAVEPILRSVTKEEVQDAVENVAVLLETVGASDLDIVLGVVEALGLTVVSDV